MVLMLKSGARCPTFGPTFTAGTAGAVGRGGVAVGTVAAGVAVAESGGVGVAADARGATGAAVGVEPSMAGVGPAAGTARAVD